MLRLTLLLACVFIPLDASNALCVDEPMRHTVAGRVAILQTIFDRSCSCPGRVNWVCYVPRGAHCSAVRCQRASVITQIYGLHFGTTYNYVIGGACAGEDEQTFKALLCGGRQAGVKSFSSQAKKPTTAPEGVRCTPLSHRELQVCWRPPAVAGQNGLITAYSVKCSGCGQDVYEVSADVTCTVITGLTPQSTVGISVSAENSAGKGPYSQQKLTKMEVNTPGNAPGQFQCKSPRGRSLELFWSHPLKDSLLGGVLTAYVIEVTDNKTGNVSQTMVAYEGQASRTYSLDGLRPVTVYRIRVAAVNKFGVGTYTLPKYATTLEDVPDGPPSAFEAMPVNNSVVVVDCAPPSPSVANGRVVGYRVQYCPCSGNTCMDTAKEVSSASTRIWIGNLRGQTMYCLRAAAFTKVGMGPWTKQITALTNMEVPPPPVGVSITEVRSDSANVCWSLSSASTGVVSGFEVVYSPVGAYYTSVMDITEQVVRVAMVQGKQSYCVKMEDLEENARYRVQVNAVNSVGKSEVASKTFKTLIKAPSGPPTNITVVCAQSSLNVHWCVPDKENRNGIISEYIVELSCSGEPTRTASVSKKASLSCSQYTFAGLTPGRLYIVRVQAVNQAGAGPFGPPIQARTKEDIPSAPGLRVPRTGSRSALIMYSRPSHSNGDIVGYTLALTPLSPDCFEEKKEELAGTSSPSSIYSVFGLFPGVKYSVCIAARNSFGSSPHTCVTIATTGVTPECPMIPAASEATPAVTTPTTDVTTPTTEVTTPITEVTTPITEGTTPTTEGTTPTTEGTTPTTEVTTPTTEVTTPTTEETTPTTEGTIPTTKETTPTTEGTIPTTERTTPTTEGTTPTTEGTTPTTEGTTPTTEGTIPTTEVTTPTTEGTTPTTEGTTPTIEVTTPTTEETTPTTEGTIPTTEGTTPTTEGTTPTTEGTTPTTEGTTPTTEGTTPTTEGTTPTTEGTIPTTKVTTPTTEGTTPTTEGTTPTIEVTTPTTPTTQSPSPVPSAPGLRVPRTGSRSALIIYSRPSHSNGDIVGYTLTLTPLSPDCFEEKKEELAGTSSPSSIYSVFGLIPGVEYNVCIAARNIFGSSPHTCVTIATTGVTEPCPTTMPPVTRPTTPPTTRSTTPPTTKPTTLPTTRPTTPPTTRPTAPPTTRPATPPTTRPTTPPTTRPTTPPTTRSITSPTTKPATPPTTRPTTPPTTRSTTSPTTKPTTPPTTRPTTPPTTRPTTPPTTRSTTSPTTKPTTPPTTRPTKPPTTGPTTPPTTRPTTPPTTKPTTPPTTKPTTPPITRPPRPTMPIRPPVCDLEHGFVDIMQVGGAGVLIRWSGSCASQQLSYTNIATGVTSPAIRLGQYTRLFFLATHQFGGSGEYSVCVSVSCGGTTCNRCSTVTI